MRIVLQENQTYSMSKTSTSFILNPTTKPGKSLEEPRRHVIDNLLNFSKSLDVKRGRDGKKIECFNN